MLYQSLCLILEALSTASVENLCHSPVHKEDML